MASKISLQETEGLELHLMCVFYRFQTLTLDLKLPDFQPGLSTGEQLLRVLKLATMMKLVWGHNCSEVTV